MEKFLFEKGSKCNNLKLKIIETNLETIIRFYFSINKVSINYKFV